MQILFNYIVLPGFIFSIFMGALGFWLERKLTARFQYRVGPPWYQNFLDIAKLFLKETTMPRGVSRVIFTSSPIISLSAVTLTSFILTASFFLHKSFVGDILVVLYLLLIPSLFTILGALSSRNPLALVGAARETKLMLAYEFVFIISLVIAVIKSGNSLIINDIILGQTAKPYILSLSGFIGFILSIFYIQAKLCIVPFDMAEAEQEIMSGTLIEYSGPLLGFYKLSKLALYFLLPLFIISLFAKIHANSIILEYVIFTLEYALIIFIISVIKNINPRLRIKDALRFFWFLLFPLGIIGIFLAQIGL